jgi:hypothetical protein
MSYYILPKNINIHTLDPQHDKNNICQPFISYTIYRYYNELYSQLNTICKNESNSTFNSISNLIKIINPYEFIFSKVPGSKYSVSKLKPKTNTFYDFFEILTTLNIFDSNNLENMNSLHISGNYEDTIYCCEILRDNLCDNYYFYTKLDDNLFKTFTERKINFMFIDTTDVNRNNYFINLIQTVMLILKCNTTKATTIIKIEDTMYKPAVDIVFFLCSLFNKVYIIKPHSNNITTFEKYIVCKGFIYDDSKMENYKLNYYRLLVFLKKLENKNIVSVINKELPYFFLNKIDDINIITGKQQIDALNQIINILKSKNKDNKVELLKKLNIQKSVNWCEKYKIPCNKFTEKTNIFLPIVKELKNETSQNI